MYRQLVKPDLSVQEKAGYSLAHIQKAFGAPGTLPLAWHAWLSCEFTHNALSELPNAYVPVWFYTTDYRDNLLGHVMIWDPVSEKFWGTPRTGYGKQWFTVESIVNAKTRYVGWSEDINGVRVVEPVYTFA